MKKLFFGFVFGAILSGISSAAYAAEYYPAPESSTLILIGTVLVGAGLISFGMKDKK